MFDSLVLMAILSFIIPFAAIRMVGGLIPSVALEIVAGIIIGINGFNLVDINSPVMEFISTFGLIYLMFLGGLESKFDIQGLKSRDFVHSPVFIGFLTFILTLVLSYFFSIFLIKTFNCAKSAVYLTLIFSTTSVAIVFPTLKARSDLKSVYKQTLTMSALIADFATLFLIAIFSLVEESQNSLVDIVIMFSIFLLAYLIKISIHLASNLKWIGKTVNMLKGKPHIQMGIRGAFAVLFIFLFLAEKLGVEVILGSFIAGILVSKISKAESEILLLKLDSMGYGFFIPFFFIYQGAKSKLPIFSEEGIVFLLVIIVGSFIIKIIASLPLKLRFSLKETIAGGFLLSGRLSLIIAASIIGVKLGIIDAQINSAIILLAAISCIISPAVFGIINKKTFSKKPARIIIVGGGRVGSNIAKHLNEKQKPVVIVEKDKKECMNLQKKCLVQIFCSNALDTKIWEKIHPTPKDSILLVTNSDDVNIKTGNLLQEKFGVYKMFARDNDPQNRDAFKQNGITPLIYTEALIKTIENAIENPVTFELLDGSAKKISERIINRLSGTSIKKSELSSLIEIILIKRGDEWLHASDDFIFRKGDVVVFIVDKGNKQLIDNKEF